MVILFCLSDSWSSTLLTPSRHSLAGATLMHAYFRAIIDKVSEICIRKAGCLCKWGLFKIRSRLKSCHKLKRDQARNHVGHVNNIACWRLRYLQSTSDVATILDLSVSWAEPFDIHVLYAQHVDGWITICKTTTVEQNDCDAEIYSVIILKSTKNIS